MNIERENFTIKGGRVLQSNENVRIYRSKNIKLLCVHSDGGIHIIYVHIVLSIFGARIIDICFLPSFHVYNIKK